MGLTVNRIYQGDCIKKLRQVDSSSIDLVFADPPFNIGYEYDVYDDRRGSREYVEWSRSWIEGVFRVLKDRGTFWLAIGDEYAAELKVAAQDIGLSCRSWVIWYYTFGVNCKRGFSRSHTHLFHFVKDPNGFTFNQQNPAVRVPSARQLVYADARANPKGRLPDNTWILRPQDLPRGIPAVHDTWYFPRVAGTFKEREGFHRCQMPEQLLGRIIRICSNPSDIVLDPFAGSGTTLVVAKKLARRWIGIELSRDYVKRVGDRLEAARVGQRLDGAEDPLGGAPATKKGKTRGALRGMANGRKPRNKKAARIRDEINRAVVAAYSAVHRGFSADYLLADPDLNARFVETCRERGAPGEPVIWNQTLLRIRKQGKLPKGASRRHRIKFREMDAYSFASEVALHLLSVEYDVKLDGILCDPELAAAFDQLANQYAPCHHTPFQYRWAALTLRKRAKQAKRSARKHQQWLRDKLPGPAALQPLDPSEYTTPGVYILLGPDQTNLYVGETFDLAAKVQQIRASAAWKKLRPQAVRLLPVRGRGMRGIKSVLIQRVNPWLNSQLLYPRLDVEGRKT